MNAARGTLFVEDAEVVSHETHAGDQHVLRLLSPQTAARAQPGNFIHIQCDAAILMRRPMSIMRVERRQGQIDILYKTHGPGTELLAKKRPGDVLNLVGPIGVPFKLSGYRPRPLLIGGGIGIPPMIFLSEHMKGQGARLKPLVLMGSEVPFPFRPRPSQFLVPGIPAEVIAAMPLMEDWGFPSRLASLKSLPGCFEGYVTDLARYWLEALDASQRADVEVFACGPTAMLRSVIVLVREYQLPCQVSLEEYMACAVGGCAGCNVRINTANGPAMKRVCVDGPVFDAAAVDF
ncbi:MAG: dihydroorotate dehydrogenase electron transfer subunit [Gammaproteobacteria bacterium]